MHKFYKAHSVFSRGVEGAGADSIVSAVGPGEIHSEIMARVGPSERSACQTQIIGIESQESRHGGVLVLVTGYLTYNKDPEAKHFTQAFFLDKQTEPCDGFYVLNDILRYISHAPGTSNAGIGQGTLQQVSPHGGDVAHPQLGHLQTVGGTTNAEHYPHQQPLMQVQADVSQQHSWQQMEPQGTLPPQQQQQQQQQQHREMAPIQPPTQPPVQQSSGVSDVALGFEDSALAEPLEPVAEDTLEGADTEEDVAEEDDSGEPPDALDEAVVPEAAEADVPGNEGGADEEVITEEREEPQTWASMAEKLRQGGVSMEPLKAKRWFRPPSTKASGPSVSLKSGQVLAMAWPGKAKGYVMPSSGPVLPPPSAVKAEASKVESMKAESARMEKTEAASQSANGPGLAVHSSVAAAVGTTSVAAGSAPPVASLASGAAPAGSVAPGCMRLWLSRLPTDRNSNNQNADVLECINGLLSEAGSAGHALEVDRRDLGKDCGYLIVSSSDVADAVVQLSKDRKLLFQGKLLRAEHRRQPQSGGSGGGTAAGSSSGGRRARGKGYHRGDEERAETKAVDAEGSARFTPKRGAKGGGKKGGQAADQEPGSKPEERTTDGSAGGWSRGGGGGRRPGKGSGGGWRGRG